MPQLAKRLAVLEMGEQRQSRRFDQVHLVGRGECESEQSAIARYSASERAVGANDMVIFLVGKKPPDRSD